jgi:hypothetical protein
MQQTSAEPQVPAMQGGVRQVITPPGAPPPPMQTRPDGQSPVLVHICIAPAGHEAMQELVVPANPPPPPSPFAITQHVSPLGQLAALVHDMIVIVPVGHWSPLETQVYEIAPVPAPTQHVCIGG